MKVTNMKLAKVFKVKGTPKVNTNKQVIQKGTQKKNQNRITMTSMLRRKFLPNKAKGDENNELKSLQLV